MNLDTSRKDACKIDPMKTRGATHEQWTSVGGCSLPLPYHDGLRTLYQLEPAVIKFLASADNHGAYQNANCIDNTALGRRLS